MAKISVGLTRSGKVIFIESTAQRFSDISALFVQFLDHDSFDAWQASEFLIVREKRRRKLQDAEWFVALDLTRDFLAEKLGSNKIAALRSELGLDTAFKCRDFGKARVYSYLRSLY